ncbi:MAG TPA: cyclic pyranopterin monophosphate synthase MoaC [Candidatus Azoamicus sp. OHIO1]
MKHINENDVFKKVSSYRMIDISLKPSTYRRACVIGSIYLGKKVYNLVKEKKIPKGDPLLLAEIAGINAAKNTSNFILLCHQINIENVFVNVVLDDLNYTITLYCIVFANAKTGVEMEAMSGVSVGLMTIYDLTKKFDPFICINSIKLLFKDGGENGLVLGDLENVPDHLKRFFFDLNVVYSNISVVLITISDRASSGEYDDISGKILLDFFRFNKAEVIDSLIIADDKERIVDAFKYYIDKYSPNLILTSGGTGLSSRDFTSEAILSFCKKIIPGIGELLRLSGNKHTKSSWLSCSVAGVYEKTLIVSLPGKPSAVSEGLYVLKDLLLHAVNVINK